MISDITLGQFFPGESVLHRADPRTKILLALLFIVAIFVANTPIAFLFLTVVTFSAIAVSRIGVRVIFKGIRPVLFVLLFTAVLNVFMTQGTGDPLVSFYFIKIYTEGLMRAFFMALRIILLIIGSSVLMSYTTSPIQLTDGLETLLSPLKKLHVPIHTFSMMMTIALRFIPTLVEETEKIMNAQKSRGADFSSGNIIRRVKALIPVLVPLFVSAFKRAEELAEAMECRCYRGDVNRTKLRELRYRGRDFCLLSVGALLLACVILLRVLPPRFPVDHFLYNWFIYRL